MGSIAIDVLDDLSCRFLVNLPAEEQEDNIRICFQLEQAHWFYTDYYAANTDKYDDCPTVGVRQFFRCAHLIAHGHADTGK